MSSRISSLLHPGFCFRSLEELKDLGKAKLTPRIEKVSRIALTLLIPLALVGDVVMTSLGALMIVPLCYYGSKLLKQVATSWLLLAGTPIVMLLYLLKGKVFDHQAPPAEKPSGSRGDSLVIDYVGDLATFPKTSAYPDTPLHKLIISASGSATWIRVRDELISKKAKQEDLQEKFNITWNGQSLSITLLDFIILSTFAKGGIHSRERHELTKCLSEFGSWQASPSLPSTARDGFVIILLRSLVADSYYFSQYSLKLTQWNIIQALQGSSLNKFPEIFLEALEVASQKIKNESNANRIVPLSENLKKNQIDSYKKLLRMELDFMPNVLRDVIIEYVYSEDPLKTKEDVS